MVYAVADLSHAAIGGTIAAALALALSRLISGGKRK
jgi:hypothetical protein